MLQAMGLPVDAMMSFTAPSASQSTTTSSVKSKKGSRPSLAGKKRAADDSDYENNGSGGEDMEVEDEKPKKKVAKVSKRPSMPGTRRSSRSAAKADVDYSEDGGNMTNHRAMPKLVSKAARQQVDEEDEVDGLLPRHKLGQRKHNPKQFGHIPGIPVGKTWELRYVESFRCLGVSEYEGHYVGCIAVQILCTRKSPDSTSLTRSLR